MSNKESRPAPRLPTATLEMIEACARACQILGIPRSTGQIYGLLYLSTRPVCLFEIAETLKLSKASCSTGTRDLCTWNAIRQVWVQGDRKDYFVVDADLSNVVRTVYQHFVKPRLNSSKSRLSQVTEALEKDLEAGLITPEEHQILSRRVGQLAKFRKKAEMVIPLAEKLI